MFYDPTSDSVCQEKLWDFFALTLRAAATRLVEAFMEHERDLMIGCDPHERSSERTGYRNGYESRTLQTRFGLLTLRKPRVRGCGKPFRSEVFGLYQRRTDLVDRCVLYWVSGGLSTRKAARAFERAFGGILSAGAVSAIVARLDADLLRFHRRPLRRSYRYVFFDGKWGHSSRITRHRGRGRKTDGVCLTAWGVTHEGRQELIDFRVVASESEANWTRFMTDLWRRGLRLENPWSERLEMIVTDSGGGVTAALQMVYPHAPKQRCVFHKVQAIADHLADRGHRERILADAAAIYRDLTSPQQARARLDAFRRMWKALEPRAVASLCYEFELTLSYLSVPPPERRLVKTTNPIERFHRELERKLGPVGVFPSNESWERAVFLVWKRLKADQYRPTTQIAAHAFTRNT